uniref:Uncharacterized protein n=1 Tax=Sus scrofa TaxID=9823 RepID=A0A4X1TPW1_PIG
QSCRELWCRLQTWLRSGVAVAVVRNQSSLEKWFVPSLRQEIYSMSLEHLVLLEFFERCLV